ncbi:hypothetical protein vseg_006695 [Gypsophila vaccaria]
MEKLSGACALGWSIELEKGLRSRKPGYPIETIRQIGPRLNQWNREPQLTMGVCSMFGLDPGEDRLFADSILFRIADAFVSGDKDVRTSIVNAFLLTLRDRNAEKRQADGIYLNMSTENRLELLRRVKTVLGVDCVKSRASVFILFGCWAELAKDVAEIRDAIFSSLNSHHVLEVRASLFAAGCFSELSDDFGYVYLEKLVTFITSQTTFPALRIAGARSFGKIGCSFLLAVKSYKAGAELVQKISEEDVQATMLIALSKISLKTTILISEQVVLLCSFLSESTSSDMHAKILRCLRLIVENSACFLSTGASPFQCLFRMLDDPSTHSALRCEVLRIMLKIIANGLPDTLLNNNDEFMKSLTYVENATRSPFLSERLLAFEIFVCISTRLKKTESMSEVDLANFSSGVAETVLDQVSVLANRLSGGTSGGEVGNELGQLLHLLLVLVGENSKLVYVILERLHLIIENFVNLHNIPAVETPDSEVHKAVDGGTKRNMLPQRVLMFHIHKFLAAFVGTFNESSDTTELAGSKLKDLIGFVCGSSLFDCSIHTFYALIWHSHVNQSCPSSKSKKSTESQGIFPSNLLECETIIHVCANNMLGGDNWCAYKAGRYAACEGVWDVANFIFHHLVKSVQSDVFCQWLKLLVQLTNCEKNVKVLLHQICISLPSDHVLNPCALNNNRSKTISSGYIEQLVDASAGISGSDKLLEVMSAQTQALYFQRWYLALRLKVLLVTVDLLKVMDTFLLCQSIENPRNPGESEVTCGDPLLPRTTDMMSSLVGVSSTLASLMEEFDLITASFPDMDSRTLMMMSNHALSCSMLAFFTKFITSFTVQNRANVSGDCLSVVVKNLVGRLWHVDSKTCMNLLSLLEDKEVHDRSLQFQPKFQLSKDGCILDDFLANCRCGVKKMMELKYQSLGVGNEGAVLQLYKEVMQSLVNVVKAWMQIPSQMTKYFFRVRPTMGSLLFWSSSGVGNQREISVSPGSHLELNLCIQLKDVPSNICSGFSKLYCVLCCRKSLSKGSTQSEPNTSYQASDKDTMVHLNKKLQCYVMKQTREFVDYRDVNNADEVIEAYVCFETNGRTQGFSTCLLDVSSFPVGSYRISWHSGGIDRHGAYCSFLPLCNGPLFNVR